MVIALVWDAVILAIAKRQVHILQTLCSSTLEQIVDCSVDNDTLPGAMHRKATDFNAVLARNILYKWRFACDFDEFLAGVAVLVDVPDVAGCHCAVEGDGDGVLIVLVYSDEMLIWFNLDLRGYPGTTPQREE